MLTTTIDFVAGTLAIAMNAANESVTLSFSGTTLNVTFE